MFHSKGPGMIFIVPGFFIDLLHNNSANKMKVLKRVFTWISKWFWLNPTKKVPEKKVRIKAEDILHAWTFVTYKGQKIPIRKSELTAWNNLPPKERKKMAMKLDKAKKKGQCRVVEIDGKKILIQNN